eukprot:CAMPEP_0172631518 /NCGR_PEP_ID=MMETSP1068-20121228/179554_1 /TAXON_ID=35684 /ORGANISM="Pseudopedinella elastica, Strain CCMP716" /LENGTH=89 /DNA_ID=CAMNT_0013442673 /DNA_START=40 /DNA_END=305 /DNA_ORIENTATION=+
MNFADAPETDPLEESGWLVQDAVFGSRVPLPDQRAEFLNVGALRKLLPGASKSAIAPGTRPSQEEDSEASMLLAKLLRTGGDRQRQLDR